MKGPPAFTPLPTPIFTWTGLYVGVNAGGTWSGDPVDVLTTTAFNNTVLTPLGLTTGPAAAKGATGSLPANSRGFIGGAQIGYNYQFGDKFVAGLETDFQGIASSEGSNVVTNVVPRTGFFPPDTVATTLSVTRRIGDLGTLRGRLGFLAPHNLLLYGTGGLAYGEVYSSTTISGAENPNTGIAPFSTSGSSAGIRVGWTAGGGLEWMFAPNWTAKVEGLYYDLGSATYNSPPLNGYLAGTTTVAFTDVSSTSSRFDGVIARVGVNYKFDLFAPH